MATPGVTTPRSRVLCVDDEPAVLEGLSLHLRRKYEVATATSGGGALDLLVKEGAPAVIISDMRMPAMSGAELLRQVRERAPDTVRMLLTGQADMTSAIAAVNDGQVFRFLTKPCPPASLLAAVDSAVEQHRLHLAERVLLEQTLRGSIKALTDVLALTNPLAFGRATRLKQHVRECYQNAGREPPWQVEVAAMLSQLGCVTLPPQTLERLYHGQPLSKEEQASVERLPVVTEQLLANLPRLEEVRAIILAQNKRFDEGGEGLPHGARVLKIANDYDVLEAQGKAPATAVEIMRGHTGAYDPQLFAAFAAAHGVKERSFSILEVPTRAVRAGSVLAEDLRMASGAVLAPRGYEVTATLVERLRNASPGSVREPVRVIVRNT